MQSMLASTQIDTLGLITAIATVFGVMIALVTLRGRSSDKFVDEASKTAVEVFNSAVKSLQDDLVEAKQEIADQAHVLAAVEAERDALLSDIRQLERRIVYLEQRLDTLKSRGV